MEASYKNYAMYHYYLLVNFYIVKPFTITPTIAILISCNLNSFGASSRNDGHTGIFDMDTKDDA